MTQPDLLKEILRLIKHAGGRFILAEKNQPAFVIMSMDEYRSLMCQAVQQTTDMSEDELLDKINREIAIWKAGQDTEQVEDIAFSLEPIVGREENEEQIWDEAEKDISKTQAEIEPNAKNEGIPVEELPLA